MATSSDDECRDTASETSQGTLIKTNAQSFSTVCQVFVEEK